MPCIQDRLRSAATRSKELFASWPVICISSVLIFLLLPEILSYLLKEKVILPILSNISIDIRISLVFSSSIAVFSSIQYISAKNRVRIEDARNELEKAYGPLYTILNRSKYEGVGKIILEIMDLDEFDKNELDEILSTYPFMFHSEIFEYWRNEIQGIKSSRRYGGSSHGIPVKFRDMINKEYDVRRRRYNKLIGK